MPRDDIFPPVSGDLVKAPMPAPDNPLRIAKEKTKDKTKVWNTQNLMLRFGADFASAATAGAMICPLITIIDR
jgi:hypothetical protein